MWPLQETPQGSVGGLGPPSHRQLPRSEANCSLGQVQTGRWLRPLLATGWRAGFSSVPLSGCLSLSEVPEVVWWAAPRFGGHLGSRSHGSDCPAGRGLRWKWGEAGRVDAVPAPCKHPAVLWERSENGAIVLNTSFNSDWRCDSFQAFHCAEPGSRHVSCLPLFMSLLTYEVYYHSDAAEGSAQTEVTQNQWQDVTSRVITAVFYDMSRFVFTKTLDVFYFGRRQLFNDINH